MTGETLVLSLPHPGADAEREFLLDLGTKVRVTKVSSIKQAGNMRHGEPHPLKLIDVNIVRNTGHG